MSSRPNQAAPHVCGQWRSPNEWNGTHVGKVVDAKEKFAAALVKHHAARQRTSVRRYEESDAPTLAEVVRSKGWALKPKARSDSYAAFRKELEASDRR